MSMFLLVVSSCSNTKTDQKNKSNTQQVSATEMSADATSLMACNHTSKIYWKGTKKPNGEHYGYLKIQKGEYLTDGEKLLGGSFIIDMTSIVDVDIEDAEKNANLVKHLKSQDFFAVDSFPTAKFEITNVAILSKELKKGDLKEFTHYITGDLSIKGITNSIEFPAKVWFVNDNIYVNTLEFKIDRTLWNVNFKSKKIFDQLKDNFIDDEISLKIDSKSMKPMESMN